MGKGRTKPNVMPIDRTGEDRPSLFVGWIDALPVPAALIRPLARGNFSLHASNGAFDRLELAPADARPPIEMPRPIQRPARTQGGAQEFCCRLGEGPDATHLARPARPPTQKSGKADEGRLGTAECEPGTVRW